MSLKLIHFPSAYLLIFLISTLGYATFSISVITPHFRCQVTGLLLLTSVNFRWIITQRLPSVSYLTLIDKYTIGCLFNLALIFIWHAIIGSKVITPITSDLKTIDGYVLYAMVVLYVVFNLVFVVWFIVLSLKVHNFKKEHGRLMSEKEDARLAKKNRESNDANNAKSKNVNSSTVEIMQYDELEHARGGAYNNNK